MLQMVLDKVNALGRQMKAGFEKVEKQNIETHRRIDRLGAQLAELEDDTPTIEEFDELKKRVDRYHRVS